MSKETIKQIKAKANELLYLPNLLEKIGNPVITGHVENTLYWYIRKAKVSRVLFYLFSISGIVSGACVPIINCLSIDAGVKAVLTSIVAVVGSVSISICSLFNFRETWRRNRVAAEKIKRECFCFIEKSCEYADMDDNSVKVLFVKNINRIIADEGNQWEESKKLTDADPPNNNADE